MHGTMVALMTGLCKEVPEHWVETHPHQRRLVVVVNDCGVSINRPKLRQGCNRHSRHSRYTLADLAQDRQTPRFLPLP
jgi:hypothetical protein